MGIIFLNANHYFVSAGWFYILYGTKNTEVACYLAWYPTGTPLYGNLGFLYSLVPVVWLLYIAIILRSKWAERDGEFYTEVISQLPKTVALRNGELGDSIEKKLKILYIDAMDGMRGLMI